MVGYKNQERFFFRFVTMHAFDTDKILIARPRLHSMQRSKNLVFPAIRLSGNRNHI